MTGTGNGETEAGTETVRTESGETEIGEKGTGEEKGKRKCNVATATWNLYSRIWIVCSIVMTFHTAENEKTENGESGVNEIVATYQTPC